MKTSNLHRARSHIVFIIGLLTAAGIILAIERSDYANLGSRAANNQEGSWVVRLGGIQEADQARQICRAAQAQRVACVIIPPDR